MKKILLTGMSGQVGWELQRTLAPLGQVVALDSRELDLSKPDAIREIVRTVKPSIIVNSAAYTAVDRAESEPELAQAVNGVAPGVFAEEAKKLNALFVHYSTDYVFDGMKAGAYVESDAPNPLGIYGKSKLAGEEAIRAAGCRHLIFRTSWVYSTRGKNFMLTMLRLAKERPALRIVNDQVGAPTWSRSLAEATALVLAQLIGPQSSADAIEHACGTYHLTSSGSTSWFGFTEEILRLAAINPMPELTPIATSEYPTPAARPANSMLSNEKFSSTFGLSIGDWRDNLKLCLQE